MTLGAGGIGLVTTARGVLTDAVDGGAAMVEGGGIGVAGGTVVGATVMGDAGGDALVDVVAVGAAGRVAVPPQPAASSPTAARAEATAAIHRDR